MTEQLPAIGTSREVIQLQQTHAYFRAQGQDPLMIAPETLRYWIAHGKTPAEIFLIAYGLPKGAPDV